MENQLHDEINANEKVVYVIDDNFKIIYMNDKMRSIFPEAKQGSLCYEVCTNKTEPCTKCPLRKENQGKSILFNPILDEWVSSNAITFEIGNGERHHVISAENLESNVRNMFFEAVGTTEYSEFIELNYKEDVYQIIYHNGRKQNDPLLRGKISEGVRKIAERFVHPEDRERFYQFWQLDCVGHDGVPNAMLNTYHEQFRKLNPDGSCEWIQLALMPNGYSSGNEVFVVMFVNVINAPEMNLKKKSDYGMLDGKDVFFNKSENVLKNITHRDEWCVISIDIENFKLFNEWHGWDTGNRLIKDIFRYLHEKAKELHGVAGYFGDDNFALLMPYCESTIKEIYREIKHRVNDVEEKSGFYPAIGICRLDQYTGSFTQAYDYAELARISVRENYNIRIQLFNPEMLEKIETKYTLLSDIKRALKNGEFTFYLQPKCNMENGKLIGAEALVRWISKDKGMVSPGVFIPILEKTGFITALDEYIWEEVCKWQRKLIDRGIEPVPVSVNVSRSDLFFMDVPECFSNLIEKYDLNPSRIEIEITESLYAEDDALINETVSKLREKGFCVMMDDFGSGYSSLNMLKDIEIDVIKIDMRFLDINEKNVHKGIGILEAVNNMAKLIGIKVIAEGVETEQQKSFLLETGCGYGQGYYFYRPMPVSDFEKLIANESNRDTEGFNEKKIEQLYLKDLLSEDMFSEILINNMLGAVAFYEVYENRITLRRYNAHYASLLGYTTFKSDTDINFGEQLYEEDQRKIFEMFEEASQNRHDGAECNIQRRKPDGTVMWVNMRTFFLKEWDNHKFFYSSLTDVTELYVKNEILSRQNKALEFLNNDMPGGYYCYRNNESFDFIHKSKRFLEIVGFSKEEIQNRFDNKMINMIHPEDREILRRSMEGLGRFGGNVSMPYRIQSKNGYISVFNLSRLVNYEEFEFFQGIMLYDINYYKPNEDMDINESIYQSLNLTPCGIFQSEVDGNHEFAYISNSLLSMLGYSRESFLEKFHNCTDNLIYKDDLERIRKGVEEQIKNNNFVSCEYRIEMADGSLKWFCSRGRMAADATGKRWFYVCITDFDYFKEEAREKEWQQAKYKTLAEIPGTVVFDYDPVSDKMTAERALEEGNVKIIVTNNFIKNIDNQSWISLGSIGNQKQQFQDALTRPMSATVVFSSNKIEGEEGHWYRSYFTSLADEDGKIYRIVGRADNIDDEMQALSDLKDQTMKDSMTGFFNNKSAKVILAQSIRRHQGGSMMMLDIDDFKAINDTFGHVNGDALLCKLADLIRSLFRKDDVLARLGGDEFLMFMPGVYDKRVVVEKVEELFAKINEAAPLDGQWVKCSIGIAISNNDFSDVNTLLEQADKALYRAKSQGKNTYAFYS